MIRFAAFILLATLASATELAMVIVKQPLYLHESDSEAAPKIRPLRG